MMPHSTKTRIIRMGKHKGWKVFIDGKKYPRKPQIGYYVKTEHEAIRRAFLEAGLKAEFS